MAAYYEFQNPVKICSGDQALEHIPYELRSLGVSRPLLLSDATLSRLGLCDLVERASGLRPPRFDDIAPDSSLDTVRRAAARYRQEGCDCIIALGGGSVLDTGKGVAMVEAHGGIDPMELIGCEELTAGAAVPLLAIPTTAGTGSEATSVAVIAHPEKDVKLEFISAHIQPQVAFLDPRLTVKLPPAITAATAMDALCHAVEAFTCLQKNPVSDGYAIAALRLIVRRLPEVVAHPGSAQVRLDLANASLIAGAAFSNSMVGGVHAIGHALGGVCHVPHGQAMAILLPHVMRSNLDACAQTYAELLLHLAGPDRYAATPADQRAAQAVEAVEALRDFLHATCQLPLRLSQVGVAQADLPRVAEKALSDGAMLFNPVAMDQNDVVALLNRAM